MPANIKQQLTRVSPLSISLILIFAAVMSYIVFRAFAATGTATLYTSPAGQQSVSVGQSFTVSVRVSTPTGAPVTGASVYLTYPADKLKVASINYAGSPYTTQLIENNSGGILRMDRAAFPMIAGGDQLFSQITFQALAGGAAPISFNTSSIVTSGQDDSNILAVRTGVTYTVSVPATSTPPVTTPTSPTTPTTPTTPTKPSTPTASGSTHASSSSSGGSSTSKPATSTTQTTSNAATEPSGTSSPAASPTVTSSSSSTSQNVVTQESESVASSVLITILDNKNHPVEGASVTINDQTAKTDKNGVVRFNNITVGAQKISVAYNGKNTTKTVQVKQGSVASPQLLKVSIVRNKFNPAILLVPVVILVAAAVFIIKPFSLAFLHRQTAADAAGIVVSDQPSAPKPTSFASDVRPSVPVSTPSHPLVSSEPPTAPIVPPAHPVAGTPGTVFAPNSSDTTATQNSTEEAHSSSTSDEPTKDQT